MAIDALGKVLASSGYSKEERLAAINSLSEIGTWRATQILLQAVSNSDKAIRADVITALGKCAAGIDVHRRMADIAVLNRSDKETASKAGENDETDVDAIGARRWAQIAPLLNQLSEEPHAEVDAPAPVPS